MQRYQGLILCTLFITVTYAEITINSFQPYEPKSSNNRSGIYANHVELSATVKDCLPPACECKVKVDGSNDVPQSLKFRTEGEEVGSVSISNLAANTNYSFNLTCGDGQSSVVQQLTIKTDYGRPKAPENVNASLVSKYVQITWSPVTPVDSFSYYKLEIDNKRISANVPKTELLYKISDEYQDGIKYTFQVETCYTNNQGNAVCSDPKEAAGTFLIPATGTSTIPSSTTATSPSPSPTTTTTKSSGIHMASLSITTIMSSLLLGFCFQLLI